MSIRNEARFVGNLVADPEGRTVRGKDGDTRVLNFTLGVNTWRGKKDDVVYPDFEAWGKTAEVIEEHCTKGDLLLVTGEYKSDSWKDKETGDPKYRVKFRVLEAELLKIKKWADGAAVGEDAAAKKAPAKAAKPQSTRRRPDPEPEPDDDGDDDDSGIAF